MKLRIICLITLCLPLSSYAVLGEKVGPSIRALSTQNARSNGAPMRVMEHTENTTNIKEFVGTDNVVYGVRWKGHAFPNMATLLGKHFIEYKIATSAPKQRMIHRGLSAESENLKISQSGRPGHLEALIYLKKQKPPEIQPGDMQ